MVSKIDSNKARLKRHARVRSKITGTAARPRLDVFRSNSYIYSLLMTKTALLSQQQAQTKKISVKVQETAKALKRLDLK